MIIGTPDNLTDEQWLRLLAIVNEDKAMTLQMPSRGNSSVLLKYDGKTYEIHPNGDVENG